MKNSDIKIYDRHTNPFHQSWEQWTEKFWNWLLSLPISENPANDDSGKYCAKNQEGPVWFLPGTAAGALADQGWRLGLDVVKRTCKIPEGKAILVALAVGEVNQKEYPYIFKSEEELNSYAKSNEVTSLEADIDGIKLKRQDLERYRVTTGVFNLNLVENNIFHAPSGHTRAVSDGYWLFIEPPTKKNFTVEFRQTTAANKLINSERFAYDVTYSIDVVS